MGSKLAFALIPLLLPFCLLVDGQSVDFVTHSIAPTSVQARVNSADYNRIQNIDISTTVFDLDALVKGTTQNFTGPVQPIYTITGLTEAKWYALRFVYNTRFNTGAIRQQQKDLVVHTPSSSGNDTTSAYLVNITQATIVGNELFLAVIPQGNQKLSLIVIPKLTCQNGTLTVPAQRINGTSTNTPARFQLNFGSMTKNVSSCQQLCIYSFVRAQIQGSNIIDNFKADTWCGTVDEAMAIAGSDAFSAIIHGNNAIIMVSLNIALTFIFRWLGY